MTWYVRGVLFSDKSEVRDLKLIPRRPCFSKARVEWREIILNAGSPRTQPIIDLSQEDITELLQDLFAPAGLIELFDLYKASLTEPSLFKAIEWERLFSANNKVWNQKIEQLFACLLELPEEFISWCYDRKLEARDLLPLNGLKDLSGFVLICEDFPNKNLTRNEGRIAIDLLVDLLLLNHSPEDLMVSDSQNWTHHLQKLRNPKAFNPEDKSKENSHWPQYVQVQKFRDGDKWQSKLSIMHSGNEDLKKKLQNLQNRIPQ